MPESYYVEPVEPVLRRFVEDFRNIVARERGKPGLLDALKAPTEALLYDPSWITEAFRQPVPGTTAAWAIYRSQDPDLCIFSMVVPPHSATRVHNHLTDGWVSLVQGAQIERKYVRRDDGGRDGYAELELIASEPIGLGELTWLKHPDEDIHQVVTASDVPSVSLHVLCNDLGTVERQSFEPEQRGVENFISGYTNVGPGAGIGRR
ncbi:MAG: cysteine dioxygenase family protein [Chloroflexi bacterium]|nr:cysteine dioxygenase family protein [Chloroflexota bacterium]MDA1240750.1 cysteine dioxygenase family protein [Chloroflexota bacterium]